MLCRASFSDRLLNDLSVKRASAQFPTDQHSHFRCQFAKVWNQLESISGMLLNWSQPRFAVKKLKQLQKKRNVWKQYREALYRRLRLKALLCLLLTLFGGKSMELMYLQGSRPGAASGALLPSNGGLPSKHCLSPAGPCSCLSSPCRCPPPTWSSLAVLQQLASSVTMWLAQV